MNNLLFKKNVLCNIYIQLMELLFVITNQKWKDLTKSGVYNFIENFTYYITKANSPHIKKLLRGD